MEQISDLFLFNFFKLFLLYCNISVHSTVKLPIKYNTLYCRDHLSGTLATAVVVEASWSFGKASVAVSK